MNSEKFIELLRGKLIPNLPPKSVVVIDKASYHCVQEDKCPTQASRKADMQAWLTKHNVAWSNDMLKVELLELCKTHRPLPTYEPRREKTGFLHICENKGADQLRGNREADQRLCFRYTDTRIPLLSKYEISSLQPSSVAVQPGLCRTWSETPKTGFLTRRLICC